METTEEPSDPASRRSTRADRGADGVAAAAHEPALVRRLTPGIGLDDLGLPAREVEVLRRAVAGRSPGGARVVFAGPAGATKHLAARSLAGELGVEVLLIGPAAVTSRFIGETEKNLGRLLDAASTSDAVLLFDEADALFGRRTEVTDSHDRYANTATLLARLAAYPGVVVLAVEAATGVRRAPVHIDAVVTFGRTRAD